MPSSEKIDCIQHSSAVAIARPRYSASVLDFETVFCFLELQETRLEPILTPYDKVRCPAPLSPPFFLETQQPIFLA